MIAAMLSCTILLLATLPPAHHLHGKHVLLPSTDATSKTTHPIELVYEVPYTNDASVGIMLIAHGCNHRAVDSWPKGKDCSECVGLPIETNIVAASLDRGWVVVAVSAVNARSHCWTGPDLPRVKAALSYVAKQTNIALSHNGKIAVAAIGASSGGQLASSLHLILQPEVVEKDNSNTLSSSSSSPLAAAASASPAPSHMWACGAVSQVMARVPYNPEEELHPDFPPLRILHMERDKRTAAAAVAIVGKLKAKMVDAAELNVPPTAINVDALRFRNGGIANHSRVGAGAGAGASSSRTGKPAVRSDEMAANVVEALRKGGIIDRDTGLLLDDPRKSEWRRHLHSIVPSEVDTLQADESAISEVMNTAWAMHEFTDAHLPSLLDWLDDCRRRKKDEL